MFCVTILTVGACDLAARAARTLPSHAVRIVQVRDAAGAARELNSLKPDLILAALAMPRGSCLPALPRWTAQCPVVVTANEATAAQRIEAFEKGVEDFVTLPACERELALRMEKALGRARRRPRDNLIRFRDFALDPGARILRREGRGEVALSSSERSLLELLLAQPGRPTSRREITRRCLRNTFHERSRAPDMLASKLRAKLRQLGEDAALETMRGEGYRLTIAGAARA